MHGLTLLRIDQLGGNSVLFPGARNLLNDEPTDTLSLADFESRSLAVTLSPLALPMSCNRD